jgi:hypothetical protein
MGCFFGRLGAGQPFLAAQALMSGMVPGASLCQLLSPMLQLP